MRVLLANPGWERRFIKFLKLSGNDLWMALVSPKWTSGSRGVEERGEGEFA